MKVTTETKVFIGIILSTVLIIGAALIFFSQPSPTFSKEDLIPAGSFSLGPKEAKVFLVEFSDFQCPSCKTAKTYVDQLTNTYQDKLLFTYRHYPLAQHQFALKAAYAAEAAGEQGKFWEMYNYLFSNQEKLSDETITAGVKLLGLNLVNYDNAVKSEKIKNKIARDLADGNKFGVDGTPTFYLNGKKLNLSSFADLKTVVDGALSK